MSNEFELYYAEDKGQPRWFRLKQGDDGNLKAEHADTLLEHPMIVSKWFAYESLTNLEGLTLYQVSTGQPFDAPYDAVNKSYSLVPQVNTPKKSPAELKAKEPLSVGDELERLNQFYHHNVVGTAEASAADFNRIESIYYVLKADDAFARVIKNKMTQAVEADQKATWFAAFNAKVEAKLIRREVAANEEAAVRAIPANAEDFTKPFYWYTTQDVDALMAASGLPRASFEPESDWVIKFTDSNRHAYYLPSMRAQDVTPAFLQKEQANYFNATKGQPAAERSFGFLVNIDDFHWTKVTFHCSGLDATKKKYENVTVTFSDTAGNHLPPAMIAAVKEVYGVDITPKTDRRQPSGSDCGPLAIHLLKTELQQKEDNARAFTAEMVAELRRSQQAQLLAVSSETATHTLNAKAEPGIPGKMVSSEWLPYFLKVNPGFQIDGNKAVYKTELTFGQGEHQKKAPVSVSIDANGSAVISLPKGQMIPSAILDISLKAFIMAQLKRTFPTRSADDLEKILNDKAECLKHIKSVMIDADDASVRQQMSEHAKSFGLIVEEPSPAVAAPVAPELAAEDAATHAPGM